MRPLYTFAFTLCLTALVAPAQDNLAAVEKRLTEFTLSNGWKFIVLERHQAPVAAFYTYADVGSDRDVRGITGMAHMFEHMAFKGSKRIGTKNYAEEVKALARVDEAFKALQAEKTKMGGGDKATIAKLEDAFQTAQEAAGKFIIPNEFGRAIEEAGGRGLNASTSWDRTDYFFSLPSNSAELWFWLESERFFEPVLREFYKEAGVVREERRMRTDSNPIGRLVEETLHAAYLAHPYGQPTVGYMSDLSAFTRDDAEQFFKTYYGPSNLTSVVVGDVDPKQIRALAEKYMARIPSRPKPEPLRTIEPPQQVERRIILRAKAQRLFLEGFHQVGINHPDYAIYDALSSLLSDGRSSRLYDTLVNKKKVCVQVAGFTGFPGIKYPGLFAFYGLPAPGKTNQDVEKEIQVEIDRLKTELVKPEELEGVKNRAKAGITTLMASNTSMASAMAQYQVLTGDWRNLFRYLDKISAVTPQDIQRVAKDIFVDKNKTVAYLEPEQ
ncbi:MAG: insulinase family protein [Bryobacterales bacterium]|nr:insulinase family protein [Bryobacterales bacterium]